MNNSKERSWIEINTKNLEYNINQIKQIIPKTTQIMAVVKANAYGHDSIIISKKLQEIGINDFAVATLPEAITLRENNITGNILILGYTEPEELQKVIDNNIMQTIVDNDYAKSVLKTNLHGKLKCHVKINTGMNRIGEFYDDFTALSEIYQNPALQIEGTFTHLCVSDSDKIEDINFTKEQINRFDKAIEFIKNQGLNPGKLHTQASYGTINYTNCKYDYVRMGILMYGINASYDCYNKYNVDFKPVMAVKSKVTSIKYINPAETVSYGRTFKADNKIKIASVGIGYADGVPRALSNILIVKINNKKYHQIGRICMDQLMIEINDENPIAIGDEVILIDPNESKDLTLEDWAKLTNTITDEIICKFTTRLKRIEI
ncbi:MAG: alanine racemase [Clostridiales bacterium]|nr:alanine racemase [Clostridiales bacterium]